MRFHFSVSSLLSLAVVSALILVAAAGASAQDIFVTPVPNAPFSAVVNVERSRVQPNGSIVNLKTTREIARDGRGRIHNEARALVPASDNKTPQLLRIHLYDPQSRVSTYLDPHERTFWTEMVSHPPSTVPPAIRFAAPTGANLPENEFTKQQDLGVDEMEGFRVRGVRETQIIPAESSDTGKEILVTDEYWYSEDLRINLLIKHNDPRSETVTMTVAQLTHAEPDPSLFEVPEGYRSAAGARRGKQ